MKSEDEEIVIKELLYGDDDEGEEEHEELAENTLKPVGVDNKCKIIKDGFGIYKDEKEDSGCKVIHRFTLINKNDVIVQVITYGATIVSVKTPDKNGHYDDIVMGFENSEGYMNERNPYFGATIGRITGVIPQYVFRINGDKYYVSKNYMKDHHANGGFIGFDKVIWTANISDGILCLSYRSRDMEEGFPGDVVISRQYELTIDNELIIKTTAHCSKPTPVDISTHIDWNLSSHLGGPKELYKHYLMVNADKYAQMNKKRIITGKLKKVSQTIFDLRIPRPIGKLIHRVPGGGYDHYMNLIRGVDRQSITFAAKLIHPESGRFVEVMSDQPGIFVYTQNNLFCEKCVIEAHPVSCWCHDPLLIAKQKKVNSPENIQYSQKKTNPCGKEPEKFGPIIGKSGAGYQRHGGIRLVPVNYPEPVSRNYNFNTFLLRPGQTYLNTTIFKFGNTFDSIYGSKDACNLKHSIDNTVSKKPSLH